MCNVQASRAKGKSRTEDEKGTVTTLPPPPTHTHTLVLGVLFYEKRFYPLTYDKIWDRTKLKALTDNYLKVAKLMISLFDRVENTVGNGENAE